MTTTVEGIVTMTARHSTRSKRARKPATPKPTKPTASFTDPKQPFPLTVHPAGYFSKKLAGRVKYFARWDEGAEEAEKRFNAYLEDVRAGRDPEAEQKPAPAGKTIRDLCNAYWNHQRRMKEEGNISKRTLVDADRTCKFITKTLNKWALASSLGPVDFQRLKSKLLAQKRLGKKKSLAVLGNQIVRIKSVFKYGVDELRLPAAHFGVEFTKPKASNIQEQKQDLVDEDGERTFTREEVTRMLATAKQPLRGMLLLAINCGLGNSDIGHLKFSHLDLDGRWLTYPRPKTKLPRKCYLWAETVEALREWLKERPEPKNPEDERLVYITKRGLSWHKDGADNPVSKETAKLLKTLKINGGRGFYTLRATYRTEAGACRDTEALFYTMGHKLPGMASEYVKRIQPERLQSVAETVHAWLYAKSAKA